ncbi:polysaccharide deacetylase family protein [Flavobacterium sp.]|jgi:peptidoglycan/xylan/chitin deacetylase (PgdA/CDA1 family)|uniref:polysaccharide deacetylase family protein n=1 Tax=Flavobacterium sp. TaxID=239 RepID=UPI0037BFCB3B
MSFWVKTNYFIKKIFSNYVWDIANNENKVFITFDDGPTPEITEWTLDQLKKYNAKATYFCIGNNIEKHPKIFEKVFADGHSIGNHTFNHLRGWKTATKKYSNNVLLCQSEIANHTSQITNLFRPPYGKIKPSQSKKLRALGYKIIMWDIISYDFDAETSKEKCLNNVLKNIKSGSIIVFHDSLKAERNLKYVLPKTLEFLEEKGFVCANI